MVVIGLLLVFSVMLPNIFSRRGARGNKAGSGAAH
jgi:hypothetical protein